MPIHRAISLHNLLVQATRDYRAWENICETIRPPESSFSWSVGSRSRPNLVSVLVPVRFAVGCARRRGPTQREICGTPVNTSAFRCPSVGFVSVPVHAIWLRGHYE